MSTKILLIPCGITGDFGKSLLAKEKTFGKNEKKEVVVILHIAVVLACLLLALGHPPALACCVHLGVLSEELATVSPAVLYVSVADKPVNVNFFPGGEDECYWN